MSEMNIYSEKIEAYLSNKLSATDKVLFEENLAKDPLFKNEVDLQNDIIETLKSNRKAQLKERLNKIDVSSGSSTAFAGVKFAASILIASLIGGGGFYYFSGHESKLLIPIQDSQNKVIAIGGPEHKNESSQVNDIQADQVVVNNIPDSQLKGIKRDVVSNSGLSENKNNVSTSPANVTVPNGNFSSEDNEELNSNLNVNVPDGILSETSDSKIKGIDIEISDKNKKELSYQYYSNKLYLYGDFTSNPYQLLEMNANKSKRLFINFDGKYFELKDNQTKVTSLKEVKDPLLLKQLFLLDNK